MIVASGLARNLVLVTGNAKHFQRMKGLTIEDWL